MERVFLTSIADVKGATDWTNAERALLDACATGAEAVAGPTLPMDTTNPTRRVRADLIRYLMLGGCDSAHPDARRPHPKGVELVGAWIDGVLDLEGYSSGIDLRLVQCLFPKDIILRDHEIGALCLQGSQAHGEVDLDRLLTTKNVELCGYFFAGRGVTLEGAKIGGTVDCRNGVFCNPSGFALNLSSARIGEDLFLCEANFHAYGEVKLVRTRIGGQFVCENGIFHNPNGRSINANSAQIGESVFLRGCLFRSQGEVNLVGAIIGKELDCRGGRFDKPSGYSINADSARVGGNVSLADGDFFSNGEVRLRGVHIGGQLAFTNGKFQNYAGSAVNAEAARLEADVLLHKSLIKGDVNLKSSEIKGNLHCDELNMDGKITLQSSHVRGGLYWKNIRGTVEDFSLSDAQIGALHDDRESWGVVTEVLLGGCRYDRLEDPLDFEDRKAWLEKMRVRKIPRSGLGRGAIAADPDDFDPRPYTHLARVLDGDGHRRMAARIREAREDRNARAELDRSRARLAPSPWGTIWPVARAWLAYGGSRMFKALFGYGNAPARAFLTIIPIIILSTLLYAAAYDAQQMAPNSAVILTSAGWQAALAQGCTPVDWGTIGWRWWLPVNEGCTMPLAYWLENAPETTDYETFHPILYAIDLFVPLVSLGQEAAWAPTPDRGRWGWWAYWCRMPIQLAGWIITAVGAAVMTGLFGRKD